MLEWFVRQGEQSTCELTQTVTGTTICCRWISATRKAVAVRLELCEGGFAPKSPVLLSRGLLAQYFEEIVHDEEGTIC